MKTILELTAEEVHEFFLKASNYCTLRLPKYFDFQPLLTALAKYNHTISHKEANKREHVNYTLFHNKDGVYAWRPFQLINPSLYIHLASLIAKVSNWDVVVKRFKEFGKNKSIKCCSIPLATESNKDTILNWWNEIEQESIELALKYEFMLTTDIADCYGSIYTHAIAWAIHGKPACKSALGEKAVQKTMVGFEIDEIIQSMSYGQTNGIPQGSTLMDFIAEIILGYADMGLSDRIDEFNKNFPNQQITEYQILRYRDDYRIFGKNHGQVTKIAKLLSEVLQELNFRLNTQKTFISCNIIKDALKPDKYYWNEYKRSEESLQKRLLLLHAISEKFPNSGVLDKEMRAYAQALHSLTIFKDHTNSKVLISIVIDIAIKNPRVFPIACSIISKILSLETDFEVKKDIYCSMQKKLENIPNTGYMKVWFQRITLKTNLPDSFKDPLCKAVNGNITDLWDISWIKNKNIINVFKQTPIIDKEILKECTEVMSINELGDDNRYRFLT